MTQHYKFTERYCYSFIFYSSKLTISNTLFPFMQKKIPSLNLHHKACEYTNLTTFY